MEIDILWPWELPEKIAGTVVVIDVFAATTNIAILLAHQVSQLYLTNSRQIKFITEHRDDALIAGESADLAISYFDVGNMPSKVAQALVLGKTVYYMSINGTRVIEEVMNKQPQQVVAGSFVNIDVLVSWLERSASTQVLLVPAADENFKVAEDEICATAIKSLLRGENINWLRLQRAAARFIRSYYRPPDEEDIAVVLSRNAFPVIPGFFLASSAVEVGEGDGKKSSGDGEIAGSTVEARNLDESALLRGGGRSTGRRRSLGRRGSGSR